MWASSPQTFQDPNSLIFLSHNSSVNALSSPSPSPTPLHSPQTSNYHSCRHFIFHRNRPTSVLSTLAVEIGFLSILFLLFMGGSAAIASDMNEIFCKLFDAAEYGECFFIYLTMGFGWLCCLRTFSPTMCWGGDWVLTGALHLFIRQKQL